jgi:hypothetical protein
MTRSDEAWQNPLLPSSRFTPHCLGHSRQLSMIFHSTSPRRLSSPDLWSARYAGSKAVCAVSPLSDCLQPVITDANGRLNPETARQIHEPRNSLLDLLCILSPPFASRPICSQPHRRNRDRPAGPGLSVWPSPDSPGCFSLCLQFSGSWPTYPAIVQCG